ncbi:hypothetical protein BHE74_00039010 [Ensete ventricosum]|nr:hypothetical protein BHE74_00039010 [Ensete ventricosum]RZS20210.1 hypothetical protein BHM03_00052703 [Ensete ventricosum]
MTKAERFLCTWVIHGVFHPSLAMNSYFEELAMSYQDNLFLSVDVNEAKV